MMTPAWGAVERATLGDWALRASAGYTQRGNSVVPVGSPGRPLADAVAEVEDWYAARGLPAKFALAGPQGFDPAGDPLGALLLERGYTVGSLTLNLTAARETVAAADPGGPAPDPQRRAHAGSGWRPTGAPGRPSREPPRRCCSTAHGSSSRASRPEVGCPSSSGLRAADAAGTTPIALARIGIGAGWAGLGAVWTDPAYRGRGLAAHLTAGLAAHAAPARTSR